MRILPRAGTAGLRGPGCSTTGRSRTARTDCRNASRTDSGFQVLRGRPIARIDRIFQKLLRIVGPELAHAGIGEDDRVDQPAFLAFDLANIDVADDIAVLVE